MFKNDRSYRSRRLDPVVVSLEQRALLSTAMPQAHADPMVAAPAQVHRLKVHPKKVDVHVQDTAIIPTGTVSAGGYTFLNFDGPAPGTNAGTGTNVNGIANRGTAVGFTIDNAGGLHNFTADPLKFGSAKVLNIKGSLTAMALGINSAGTVVGSDGSGKAFVVDHGVVTTFIPPGGNSATALGINDRGTIVGQYVTASASPGFIRVDPRSYITVHAPSVPDVVNAQGISNDGLVVGFYVGTDNQDHGFMALQRDAMHGTLTATATAIADPTIPNVQGENGATFVFSQVLGVNDKGIAVGYYGDSTGSQHGFLYDTHTGKYTFLDDPGAAFYNGVEVTQITGITNAGEITGFYSDASGVFHGFVAKPPRL